MVNIMNYKSILYALNLIFSIVALSGINYDKLMKKNRPAEARMIVLILAIASSYLITNFIVDFMS